VWNKSHLTQTHTRTHKHTHTALDEVTQKYQQWEKERKL